MSFKRFTYCGVLLLSCLLVLAACQSQPETANTPVPVATEAAEPEADPEPEPEEVAGGELVIYSGRGESLVQPLLDMFEAETGIEVQVRYGNTAEMAALLLEEGANSPADVYYAQDPGGLGAVADAGLLAPLPAEILAQTPARFVSPDNNWVGVSGRARVVVYNTEAVDPAELPADLEGFTDPQWQGRIGWAPTNGSFQAMVTAMRSVWGEERTREWLAGIQANEPVVFEGNAPIVQAVAAEEIEIGFVNHYYLHRFLAEEGPDFGAANHFLPGGGPGSLIMVSGAGILNTAPNAENAQRFIEFLLSPEAQQYFATETFEYPVIEGVAISAQITPLEELDAVAADIPLSAMSDLPGTAAMLSELGILP